MTEIVVTVTRDAAFHYVEVVVEDSKGEGRVDHKISNSRLDQAKDPGLVLGFTIGRLVEEASRRFLDV